MVSQVDALDTVHIGVEIEVSEDYLDDILKSL